MKFVSMFSGSFYSASMYRELRQSRGHGFAYSFLLVLVTLCFTCILYAPVLNRAHQVIFVGENGHMSLMDDVLTQIAAQTPEMIFENNVLTTKEPGAHVIHLKVNAMETVAEGEAITIDTSGKTTYSNMQTPILITAHEIITKHDNKTEIKTFEELSGNAKNTQGPTVINADIAKDAAEDIGVFVKENLRKFYLIVGGVSLLVMAITLYIARIIMTLFLALAGLLVANILRTEASFEELMRVSAVSFTPVAILSAIIPMIGDHGPNSVTLFALGVIMLTVALYVSRDDTTTA